MIIKTSDIPGDGLEISVEEPAGYFPALRDMEKQGECRFVSPIRSSVMINMIQDIYKVTGRIDTAARLSCSRCLTPFTTKLTNRFTLTYTRQEPEEVSSDEEIEIRAEQIGLQTFKGDIIDLQEAIGEQVILALPFQVHCRTDCKGLCVTCGIDLNTVDCGCAKNDSTDPRFAALKNLKLSE